MFGILEEGIRPGGPRGDRKHVHCSPYYQRDKRCVAGMRFNADIQFHVNLRESIREGHVWYTSTAGAILTPETVHKRNIEKVEDGGTSWPTRGR